MAEPIYLPEAYGRYPIWRNTSTSLVAEDRPVLSGPSDEQPSSMDQCLHLRSRYTLEEFARIGRN